MTVTPRLVGISGHVSGEEGRAIRRSIQPQVDVSVAGDLRARDALDGRHFGQDLGGNHARRFSQLAGQCEGRRDAQLAEAGLLGRLDNYLRFNAIADLQISRYTLHDALFEVMEHKKTSIAAARQRTHIWRQRLH